MVAQRNETHIALGKAIELGRICQTQQQRVAEASQILQQKEEEMLRLREEARDLRVVVGTAVALIMPTSALKELAGEFQPTQ